MYKIKALCYGSLPGFVPGPAMFFQEKLDQFINVVGYIWLVQGMGKTIVIDTGVGRRIDNDQRIGGFFVKAGQDPETLLRNEGVSPEDVDFLILTHLHYDHCMNVDLFKNAQIVLSARGWEFVNFPGHQGMVNSMLFPSEAYRYLHSLTGKRLILALSEYEVTEGINVFWTGGHTPCSQAVSIKTKYGKAVVTGDVVSMYANIEENIPVAYSMNLEECYHSMDRIRREADIILPTHDPVILKKYPTGIII